MSRVYGLGRLDEKADDSELLSGGLSGKTRRMPKDIKPLTNHEEETSA